MPARPDRPARPRLILHIGAQKTGSTAIQSALDSHPESLAASGLRFATSARAHISHTRMIRAFDAGRPRWPFVALRKELKAHPDKTLILSCELFLRPDVAPIFARFLGPDLCAQTQVIAYLRRPDLYLEALYKQHLKNGLYRGSLTSYLAGRIDQLLLLKPLIEYEKAFGRPNMCVIPYERAAFPAANGVADFAARIGWQSLPPDALGTGATNASLSLPYCHALGACADLSPPLRRALIRALIADPTVTMAGNDVLSPRARLDLLRHLAPQTERLRKRYCPDRASLFSPPEPTAPPLPEADLCAAIAEASAHINALLPGLKTRLARQEPPQTAFPLDLSGG